MLIRGEGKSSTVGEIIVVLLCSLFDLYLISDKVWENSAVNFIVRLYYCAQSD